MISNSNSIFFFFLSFFLFCGSKFRESERSLLGAWKVSPVYLGALTGLKAKNALTAFTCTVVYQTRSKCECVIKIQRTKKEREENNSSGPVGGVFFMTKMFQRSNTLFFFRILVVRLSLSSSFSSLAFLSCSYILCVCVSLSLSLIGYSAPTLDNIFCFFHCTWFQLLPWT